MAVKNFNFTIDTIKENYSIVANVKQLDNVVLNITVTENNQLKDQIKEITSVDWSKLSLSDRKIIIDSVTMLSRIVNI